jgi:hypothetical protein
MPIDMKDLARRGAQSRLAELVAEMDSILGAFPDLGKAPARPAALKRRKLSAKTKAKMRAAWARRKAAAGGAQPASPSESTTDAAPKRKRTMSAEARGKISAAQKRRWKKHKAAKKGTR